MEDNTSVGEIDKPVWFVEAEPCQEVSWRAISEGSVAEAPAAEVEEGGDEDGDH